MPLLRDMTYVACLAYFRLLDLLDVLRSAAYWLGVVVLGSLLILLVLVAMVPLGLLRLAVKLFGPRPLARPVAPRPFVRDSTA